MPFQSPFPTSRSPTSASMTTSSPVSPTTTSDGSRSSTRRPAPRRRTATCAPGSTPSPGALAARGVKPGDVVALHCPNTAAFIIAFHGILRAGATATTINSLYTPPEIANQLRDSGAIRYVTVSLLLPAAMAGCAEVGLGRGAGDRARRSRGPRVADGPAVRGCGRRRTSRSNRRPTSPCCRTPPAPPARPRASCSPTATWSPTPCSRCRRSPSEPDDVVLAVLPFFHIYGMNVIMSITLRVRAKLVTMPRFDLDEFLRLIDEQRITFLYIAPPMAVALAKHPAVDTIDTSSVRAVLSGAAPLDEALGEAVKARLGCGMLQGYGMTELSPVSHALPLDRDDLSIGSVGLAVASVEFKVIDPATGEEIEAVPGGRTAPGELWVRGPGVMVGYLGNDAGDPRDHRRRRLPAHRRHRRGRARGRGLRRRPAQGADQVQGLPGAAGRAGGRAADPPGHRGRRGGAAPRRGGRRGPARVRRAPGGRRRSPPTR